MKGSLLGKTFFWLLIGAGVLYWLNQSQTHYRAQGSGLPCSPGFAPGTDQMGNQTCLPVGSLSGW